MRRRVRKGIWRTLCDSWRTFCHFGLRPLQREELRRRRARRYKYSNSSTFCQSNLTSRKFPAGSPGGAGTHTLDTRHIHVHCTE